MNKLRVGILGATGAVGQRFVQLLASHPWFEITAVAASERSAGKTYREAVHWLGDTPIPESVASLEVQRAQPPLPCDLVFSGLDSRVAGTVEKAFAESGYPVISNARNYRLVPEVPLLIPEVNPDHTALIERQPWYATGGFIVTNPNCSTVGLVLALKPLYDAFGIEQVHVTTLQALSGAGYPGVSALDALGNVIPYISGEEEKLATEPLKILGALDASHAKVLPAPFTVSAQCTRVPVLDGHLECVSVKLKQSVSVRDVKEVFRTYVNPVAELPSSPEPLFQLFEEPFYPQPRLHVQAGNGMSVSIGRIRSCEVMDIKFVVLSHNTIRGAAGGAVLNAELLRSQGRLLPYSA